MPKNMQQCLLLPVSLICIVLGSNLGLKSKAAVTNGADIYCFMRNGGNEHPPSWQAAYQFIKNQKQGLFKTSPKQAATMIVEEVVRDPIKYENCTNYLGDLYTGESSSIKLSDGNELPSSIESTEKSPKGKYIDRYNY